MDLSKISSKLNNGEYKKPEEFEADFRLMLDNCKLYNFDPNCYIRQMCTIIEKEFNIYYNTLITNYNTLKDEQNANKTEK